MTIAVNAAASALGRAIGAVAGYGLTKLWPAKVTAIVDCTDAWNRYPDAFRPNLEGAPFVPAPQISPAGVAGKSVASAGGRGPAPDVSPTARPGAGHPNLTRTEMRCVAYAVREYGDQCTTEFGREFWTGLADKVNAAVQAEK